MPPWTLSLVGPTELALAVQHTRILPSGRVLRCTQGKIQKVFEILFVVISEYIYCTETDYKIYLN
jgi:hypothetical protein